MRRTVVVLPGFYDSSLETDPLRQPPVSIARLAERGEIFRLAPIPVEVGTPEALYLGMHPREGQLRQGPLTVAWIGADPPERSTHFHLSLGSLTEEGLSFPSIEHDLPELTGAFQRLNTKDLTTLVGKRADHALVWEGWGDLRTDTPAQAAGRSWPQALPEGDCELPLRRLIDDSVNLLTDLEWNRRRIGDGLAPINILWPWGEGRRSTVPNLALRYGEPAEVRTRSIRAAGLARLAGLQLEPTSAEIRFLVNEPSDYADDERADQFVHEFNLSLPDEPWRTAILIPGVQEGIGLIADSRVHIDNRFPFDARIKGDGKLPVYGIDQAVRQLIATD